VLQDAGRGPVIVLGYAHSGAALLSRVMAGHAELTCTSGTGLLPLCDMAASAWRQVENRQGSLSSLAIASIRAMVGSLLTTALASQSGGRWCEVASAHPRCAETFLQAFPSARVICLHRNCPDVIRSGIQANPWGLAETSFGAFTVNYPGNPVATIAAYWAASTEPLLDLEQAHPDTCLRVSHEDLVGCPDKVGAEIAAFLSLDPPDPASRHLMSDDPPSGQEDLALGAAVPFSRIPPPLLAAVNGLMDRLGYPPVPAVSS
jgi:Sulfotransferase family